MRVSTRVHMRTRQTCNSFSLLPFQEDCLLFFALFYCSLFFLGNVKRGGGVATPVIPPLDPPMFYKVWDPPPLPQLFYVSFRVNFDKRIYVHQIYWCISKKVSPFKITFILRDPSFSLFYKWTTCIYGLNTTKWNNMCDIKCIFRILRYINHIEYFCLFVCFFIFFNLGGVSFFNYIVLTLYMLFKLC